MAGQWCCYMMAGDIDMVAESVLESVIRVEVGMPRGEGGGGGQGGLPWPWPCVRRLFLAELTLVGPVHAIR